MRRLQKPYKDRLGRIYQYAKVAKHEGYYGPGWHIVALAPWSDISPPIFISTRMMSRVETPKRVPAGRNARVPLGWKTEKEALKVLKEIAMD